MNMERAQRLRNEGRSWNMVARQMKTTLFKLRKAWVAAGLPEDKAYRSRRRKKPATPEQIAQAKALLEKGMRWKAVALEVGANVATLEKMIRKPKRPPSAQAVEALRLRKLGNRWKDVARLVGRDPGSIQAEVQRYVRAGLL